MTLSPAVDVLASDPVLNLELEKLDPTTLVIGTNVRVDKKLDQDLIDGIRARGVRTPISAYRDADGRVVVLRGQRRTLIAVMVGRPLVPVVIEPEPDDTDRVVDQLGENDHRTGLNAAEHVAAYEQLAAYGLSAAQISAMTATDKERVKAGLRVARSNTARQVVDKIPDVDLFRAQQLEEFADSPDILARLTDCLVKDQGFDHWAQHHRNQRQEAAEQAEAEQAARTEGYAILASAPAWTDPKCKPVDYLKHGRKNMTTELHAGCPGRAVMVHWSMETVEGTRIRTWYRREYCTDYLTYGHGLQPGASAGKLAKDNSTPEQRAQEAAKRRQVIKYNAMWRSATTVRHRFLVDLLGRKKLPNGAGSILAAAHTVDREKLSWSLQRGSHHAHTMLGLAKTEYRVSDDLKTVADGVSDDRAHIIALCMVLAAYEDGTDEQAWRITQGWAQRYLRFLQGCGYELADVERIAAGLTTIADVEADEAAAAGDNVQGTI